MEDNRKIAFLINCLPNCNDDVDLLISAFTSLGYTTKKIESPISGEALREKLNKINTNRTDNAIVIFYGYGFSDFVYIGDDVLSYLQFAQMFHLDIYFNLVANVWWKKPKGPNGSAQIQHQVQELSSQIKITKFPIGEDNSFNFAQFLVNEIEKDANRSEE